MLYSDCGVFACRGSLAEELHYHVTPVFLISKIEGFTEVLVICSLNYTIYGLDLQGPGYRDAKKPEPLHPCNVLISIYILCQFKRHWQFLDAEEGRGGRNTAQGN